MGGVEEVGEEEADELEGHADHAVPDEAEERADWEAIDVDFVRGIEVAWGEDGGFPIGRCGICGGCFIGLCQVSKEMAVLARYGDLTGGCSSSFSPRSGLAFRFAKTPSLDWDREEIGGAPVWCTDIREGTGGFAPGSAMTPGRSGLSPSCTTRCSVFDRTVLVRIKRWRSSPSSFNPSSESEPSSKVSANVRSASDARGSSEVGKWRDEGDEARDRNEGGGEEGLVSVSRHV